MEKELYGVRICEEDMVIPTYEVGEPNKNPIFSENRVYQGSTGKVYPYPVIEKIYDRKVDKTYKAVILENQYIRVTVLPQLGGRIYRAYDKTNGYDFVYYNRVIKPALVGLTGPWISGGIEFNWPQHHRPTTFLPVDYKIRENMDGSKSLLIHDIDQMYGTKMVAEFTLYPDKAYIEIKGQLYNGTPFPQTFLWWANPAVAANDYTQSIFPPDVHAVMDHGKRDVSRFPIATGVYYKKDYSAGVDISRYKNIPVPTSFMAEHSDYDFLGGYDYQREAGILHVADHHVSPGKKQWTWGCGDFGKAWDRNLTDEDGPYIELMAGVYTDNQPDFTWLKPFEEKTFKQYFMPYKAVGAVKNATFNAVVNMETRTDGIYVCVYASSEYKDAKVILKNKGSLSTHETVDLSPIQIFEKTFEISYEKETDLTIEVYDRDNNLLVNYTPEEIKIEKMPEPAKAAKDPSEIMTNEELYLTGLHIEQYRHATYDPDDYYLEGLKRDPADIRINNAYGSLLLRRGLFKDAESYFRKAIERLTWKNPNPYNSEPYYNLGVCLRYQGRAKEAYDAFYKASWSNEQQEMSYYYLAAIATEQKKYEDGLEFIEKSLIKNSHNIKARGLKAAILRKLGRMKEASAWVEESLNIDSFDYMSGYERILLMKEDEASDILIQKEKEALVHLMRNFSVNFIQAAISYSEAGLYLEAIEVLQLCSEEKPMLKYYEGYYYDKLGLDREAEQALQQAMQRSPYCTFPNKLEDILVLEHAIQKNSQDPKAPYYLGNLYYDKKQYSLARELWEKSVTIDDTYPTALRNLSLLYYNRYDEKEKAKDALERAFHLDTTDSRVFLELEQLYKKLGVSAEDRIQFCEKYPDTLQDRDDMYVEYITLLNQVGQYEKAYELIMSRKFHPWEGGEGKITTQYKIALLEIAKKELKEENYEGAIEHLTAALSYPENLGEGKLEGTKDNHLNYYLGIAYEALGNTEMAEKYYTLASLGTDDPAGMMYYYDQPADMILYQGLALKKLGKPVEANTKFYKLLDYGEQHIFDEVKIDYFAVSLPDFLIFKDDLNKRNKAHCHYLIALANLGLDNREKAKKAFAQALQYDCNHMDCILYTRMLD
ncbi:MAG: DUF5107 domain-containing protein [Clostridiales bacterium]|nr:DUF5107 domain-containing protein [Clostridiales bacterium]